MADETVEDKTFGRRYVWWSIGKFIPTLVGFYCLWDGLSSSNGSLNWQIWVGILLFIGGILMWAFQEHRMFRSYRCPRCNKHLPEPTIPHAGEGDPIMYRCEECEVTWDTTLRR